MSKIKVKFTNLAYIIYRPDQEKEPEKVNLRYLKKIR